MKYKVLKTCHAGGRMCREGCIVEFADKVESKYLELCSDDSAAKVNDNTKPGAKGQSFGSLNTKPTIKTGMAAGLSKESNKVDKVREVLNMDNMDKVIGESDGI